jgi:integrase
VLRGLLPLRGTAAGDSLVFPGQRRGRPLSIMAMAMLLRRLGCGGATVHGFRSSFRDWAGETTHHAREVVEAALAHRVGSETERAYARGDLFRKRRTLMEDWAGFCARAIGTEFSTAQNFTATPGDFLAPLWAGRHDQ